MTDATAARSYRPGQWFGIFGEHATVLLPPSEKARVGTLWALVDDGAGFDVVLDALISEGLRDLPGFVLVSTVEGETKVVIRGEARAWFTTGADTVEVAGTDVTTWAERSFSGVTATRLVVGAEGEQTDGAPLPIDNGLVRVSEVAEPAASPQVQVPAAPATSLDDPGPRRPSRSPSPSREPERPSPRPQPEPEPEPAPQPPSDVAPPGPIGPEPVAPRDPAAALAVRCPVRSAARRSSTTATPGPARWLADPATDEHAVGRRPPGRPAGVLQRRRRRGRPGGAGRPRARGPPLHLRRPAAAGHGAQPGAGDLLDPPRDPSRVRRRPRQRGRHRPRLDQRHRARPARPAARGPAGRASPSSWSPARSSTSATASRSR